MRTKIFILIIILSSSSCIHFKAKGKKGVKKYYQEFFIDGGIVQYFIKPLEFKNKKDIFTVDFTFRDSVKYKSYITANYSVFSDYAIKNIDSAFFVINNKKIKLQQCERLFIEKKKKYHIRNSCKITYNELTQIIDKELVVKMYFNNTEHIFYSANDTRKGLEIIKERVIDIIELNKN